MYVCMYIHTYIHTYICSWGLGSRGSYIHTYHMIKDPSCRGLPSDPLYVPTYLGATHVDNGIESGQFNLK